MLTKCPECHKDVSSEADKCIHCGFPLKNLQPRETTTGVVQADNSSKRGLGIFFIFLGIIGVIGGFVAIQPSNLERLQGEVVGASERVERTSRAFEEAGFGNFNSAAKRNDTQDARAQFSSIQSKRYVSAACWFVPGGVLFVLGLVMRAGKATTNEINR
jgi:hypothetical protein